MKITLSFPKNGDEKRPEKEVEAQTIPRIGEMLSWDGSPNFIVEDVFHDFSGDSGNVHQIVVWLSSELPA